MSFLDAVAFVLSKEGGFANHPSDRGGVTNYGISSRANPDVNVRNLTPEQATQIYKQRYWDAIGADNLPPRTALVAFDAAVNHGPAMARSLLQRTGGDPDQMIAERRKLYQAITTSDPSQRVFAQGWENRLKSLETPQRMNPNDAMAQLGLDKPATTKMAPGDAMAALGLVDAPSPAAPPATTEQAASTPMQGGRLAGFVRGAKDIIDAGAQIAPRVLASIADRGPFGVRGAILEAQGQQPNQVSPVGDVLRDQAKQVDQQIASEEAGYQQARTEAGRGGMDWMRLGGNVAASAPAVAAAPTGGAALSGRMIAGAGVGGSMGLAQPVTQNTENFWEEKGKQAGVSAAGGALAAPITGFLARLISPSLTPGTRELAAQGVRPTVGQSLGGAANRVEQALSSVPFLGDMIRAGRYRSVEDFNRAAYSRALEPLGEKYAGPIGREGIEAVERKLSDAYGALLPKLTGTIDDQAANELRNLVKGARTLGADKARQFATILQQKIGDKITPQGNMSGETIKAIESELGRLASGYRGSADMDSRLMGDALRETQAVIRRMVERHNPQFAGELQKINEGWANFVRLQSAASMLGARDGVFSPAQLLNAVKGADKSVRKGAFSRGDALMQDLAESGKRVLGDTVPDSGTPLRTLTALGAGGFVEPMSAAAGAVGMLPYTRFGQELTHNLMTQRPALAAPTSNFLRLYGPAAGAALAPALSQ